ncbi:uncharacterized protein PHALS_15029 [Plasmopara halstedii]|uniref:Uncharacterized protein n=1 Tax=Plasmopara halstedii TaxID=4781 RepID=A0A0P1A9W1_PLAHL|nr:uncharacterized protein PHALS_15029 [Plasmopara halstedii]CEG37128.1 hypothetical protein PHALS_15029 [Plasmopara halstedii]|eukprot:XP_024573497.1 hypothetical protein PHALS_15029 [Plasmopara halstedii]
MIQIRLEFIRSGTSKLVIIFRAIPYMSATRKRPNLLLSYISSYCAQQNTLCNGYHETALCSTDLSMSTYANGMEV